MKLRRYADAGKNATSLGLLLTRTPPPPPPLPPPPPPPPPPPGLCADAYMCAASAGGASNDDPLPPWVPFGLRILTAHQLQYGDGSTGALYVVCRAG